MRSITRRRLVIMVSLLFGLAIFAARTIRLMTRPAIVPTRGTVRRVVDGDTFHLTNRLIVRLLEVDAPEFGTEDTAPAREATIALRSMIDKQTVRMSPGPRHLDPYGRYLAYVFVEEPHQDGNGAGELLVNAELARRGLVRAKTWSTPGEHYEAIRQAEAEARAARRGLWGKRRTAQRPAPGSLSPPAEAAGSR